ncbi:uncharacterized protein A4U43_C07F22980 [Asparagus officinalis]|uniref:Uncharacterized protein n=1 Tax=Asparagus officinalis TaxID=4686 RepID=A0A5P1EEC3_ASPOF|nr:uncharacterized protein A4U43_C07F22980 [Asparagus officinalis]
MACSHSMADRVLVSGLEKVEVEEARKTTKVEGGMKRDGDGSGSGSDTGDNSDMGSESSDGELKEAKKKGLKDKIKEEQNKAKCNSPDSKSGSSEDCSSGSESDSKMASEKDDSKLTSANTEKMKKQMQQKKKKILKISDEGKEKTSSTVAAEKSKKHSSKEKGKRKKRGVKGLENKNKIITNTKMDESTATKDQTEMATIEERMKEEIKCNEVKNTEE